MVVEEVGEGSALAKAGLQAGDILLSWHRLPNPPANPEGVQGELGSPFDWEWLKIEQAPRGTIRLTGWRDVEVTSFEVAAGRWDAKVRPRMPKPMLRIYLQGKELVETRELEAASQVWSKLSATTGYENDWRLPCWILMRTGGVWGQAREWSKAHAAYRSALKEAHDPLSEVVVWQAIGDSYWATQTEFEQAGEAFASAQGIRIRTWGTSLALAKGMNNLGGVAWGLGDFDTARGYFEQALEIRQELAPDSPEVAASLANLGTLTGTQGQPAQAAEYYQQALEIQQKLVPGGLVVATILDNLGAVTAQRGELSRAAGFHQRAQKILQKLDPSGLTVGYNLNNVGSLATDRGELDEAADYYQQALEIFQVVIPEGPPVAIALNNLGNLAYRRGDLDRAADLHQRALDIRRQLAPDSLDVAHSLSALGNVALARSKFNQAIEYQHQALRIRQTLAPGSIIVALGLNDLGVAYFRDGALARAAEYHQQSLTIWQQLAPRASNTAISLANLGSVALEGGKLDKAAEYYRQALEIQQQQSPGSSGEAAMTHALARVFRSKNQPRPALAFLLRALNTLEDQVGRLGGSHDVQAAFRANRAEYYRDTLELFLELDQPDEAFHTLERSRAQTLLAQLAERDLVFSDVPGETDQARRRVAANYNRAQQQLADLNPKEDSTEIEDLKSKLRRLREERDDIAEKIRKESPKLAALQYPRPVDLKAAQQTLDRGTAMLSFSVGKETTDLFIMTNKGSFQVYSLPVGEEKLTLLVSGFHTATNEQGWKSRTASRIKLSKHLYETLIKPAEPTVQQSDRLLIIADGPLHLLPFAALIREGDPPPASPGEENGADSGREWHYLVEWKPLHSVLSATVYTELKKTRRPSTEASSKSLTQLAAFGDPLYPGDIAETRHGDIYVRASADRGFDFRPLPHTRREVDGIASLFPSRAIKSYLGAEATEERAKSLDRDTRILHFATHGKVDDRFPLNSFVALTIPEESSEDRDNGLLQAWEIFERVRIDADLVVLSACQSGLGKELRGEGLYGLTRAFQYAGARTVAATLWSVADETTAELMIRFYRHLRDGKPKDVALQQAQIELIRGQVENARGEVASAPYYWAAFQLIGDWQ
ncbi:MAG: CHAT domain-containing protein [bacterium]|nr:CHAT domain-containing protein [bacterium]